MPFDASNKTSSSTKLTVERARYNARILGGSGPLIAETKEIKDFLSNEKIFYGRIDAKNNPVYPKADMLKLVGPNTGQVYVHNFVADAFNALISRAELSITTRQVTEGQSVFFPLVPEKGLVSATREHSEMIARMSDHFVSVFLGSEIMRSKISNFETFLPFFESYVLRNAPAVPITRSSFILSRQCSVLSSGLAVEVYSGDYSDDEAKKALFYDNQNFALYRDIAYYHGFVLDKHIPWRLVADINSPNMRPFIEPYYPQGDAKYSVMSTGFTQAFREDPDLLLEVAVSFYNNFAIQFPYTQVNDCSVVKTFTRSPTTAPDVIAETTPQYWFSLYSKVRNLELGIGYEENQLNYIMENASDLINKVDNITALRYINNKFNSVEHFGGSLFHDVVRDKMESEADAEQSDVDLAVKRAVRASKFSTY
jgi:hypothetical protein